MKAYIFFMLVFVCVDFSGAVNISNFVPNFLFPIKGNPQVESSSTNNKDKTTTIYCNKVKNTAENSVFCEKNKDIKVSKGKNQASEDFSLNSTNNENIHWSNQNALIDSGTRDILFNYKLNVPVGSNLDMNVGDNKIQFNVKYKY